MLVQQEVPNYTTYNIENVDTTTVTVSSSPENNTTYTYRIEGLWIERKEDNFIKSILKKQIRDLNKVALDNYNKKASLLFNNLITSKSNKANTRKMRCKNWAKLNHR